MANWMDWNRSMSSMAWLGAMVSAAFAQEAPDVLPPRAVVIDDRELRLDLSEWWSFNEARFLTNGARRQSPDAARMASRIVPTLRKALDSDSPDLIGAALMALARIGHEVPEAKLAEDFARHLHHRDQEVRETAALALGVAGIDADRERELLLRLVRGDGEPGAADGAAPTRRTRVFATYGLGLLANGSNRLATKRTVFQVMQWLLRMEHRDADLPVAAVHALAQLQLDGGEEAAAVLQTQVLELLTETWEARRDQPGDLVACACPSAIGKLLGRGHPRSGELVARFVEQLGRNLPTELGKPSVTQSCAIALGLLAQPDDATVVDALAAAVEHPDLAARMFACLALGEIGGLRARGILQQMLANPAGPYPVYAREWAAMALGVAVRQGELDAEERAEIYRAFLAEAGATARVRPNLLVAAGLARADAAVAELWKRSRGPSDEACAEAYCRALQLLGNREALPGLRGLFAAAQRDFRLRVAAARALASLGEEGLGAELIRGALASPNHLAKQYCSLLAAGEMAVDADVDALLQAVADASRSPLTRSFAAIALGTAARRAKASWSLSLGLHTNPLAAPASLSNNHSGVLDLP